MMALRYLDNLSDNGYNIRMEHDSLILIDGNSLVNRAYFALPPLNSKDGVPTNAVYGFANILVRAILEYKPKYIAVAFDMRAPTFRHKMYDGYKATRHGMPDDLAVQMPILKSMLDVMGIKHIGIEGIEADDVIGTIAKAHEVPTLILTGDRDSFQLIDETTSVLFTKRGITEVQVMTKDSLKEYVGLTPQQIVDYKSLAGDSSDNIPGVPGIGDKRATDLLQKYGSAEEVFANAENIGGKLGEKLLAGREISLLSRALATIKTDCEIDATLPEMTYEFPFSSSVFEFFEHMGFKSLVKRAELFAESKVLPEEKTIEPARRIKVNSTGELLTAIGNAKEFAITFGRTVSISTDGLTQFDVQARETLFDVCPTDEEIVTALAPVLASSDVRKIVYNAKSAIKYLSPLGAELISYDDVALMEYLAGGRKTVTVEGYAEAVGLEKMDGACALMRGALQAREKLSALGMTGLYDNVELPLIEVLYRMEKTGFLIDRNKLAELKSKFSADEREIADRIYLLVGKQFNINSPKQLASVLFEDLALPYPKRFGMTARGVQSTSAEVLSHISSEHPVVPEITRYRYVSKLISTYIDGLGKLADSNGVVHTEFNQTKTETGRLSSSEPNLQNIPVRDDEGRVLRALVVAREGNVLVSADYSQIELRVMAHLSGDENLISAFRNGEDVHTSVAKELFGTETPTANERRVAKTVNFGIIYGMSSFGLSERLGIFPREAKEYIDKYFARYPKVKEYLDGVVASAREKGYAESLLGRRRAIPELTSGKFQQRAFGERAAMNMPLQSTAADIIKIAMLKVHKALSGMQAKLILQVHDELIVDTPLSELDSVITILRQEMESAVELTVPLTVEVGCGRDWLSCK